MRKLSFLLMVPVILLSLLQCTRENSESDKMNQKAVPVPTSPRLIPVATENTKMNTIPSSLIKNENPNPPPPVLLDKAILIVDISEQKLYLYQDEVGIKNVVKSYPVSTSKYGIGSQAGSNKTPLGRHRIEKKIGEGVPTGTIFKARQNTGKIAEIDAENVGDLITTRIMWLKGLEPGKNSGWGIDSYKRYIYIHGTAEENKIGQRASHGCVRMYNRDVIDLFIRVKEGSEVYIRE